jgi:hypothetical protein
MSGMQRRSVGKLGNLQGHKKLAGDSEKDAFTALEALLSSV